MKRISGLPVVVMLAGILSQGPWAELGAQVHVGAHGTLIDMGPRTAVGLGGQVGVLLRDQPGLTLVLEAVGERLWPSCDIADCGASVLQANLLARRRVASYAEVYGGLGFVYEDFTAEQDERKLEGDDIGLSVLAGTQAGTPGGIRPFLEVRLSFMNDVANRLGGAVGLRVPLRR